MQFTSPDTLIPDLNSSLDWNRYAYARGNPLRYSDPSGHWPWDPLVNLWNWYTGSPDYKGSQGMSMIAHGPRQLIADALSIGDTADSLPKLLVHSLLQEDSTEITGNALEEIQQDPDLLEKEKNWVAEAQAMPEYKKSDFVYPDVEAVTFGGPHDPAKAWSNELTWMVRAANVTRTVSVTKDGEITFSYTMNDTLDLMPDPSRSWQYNVACTLLGVPFHIVMGGNEKMHTSAKWTKTIPK
jgi:hypothetical protein